MKKSELFELLKDISDETDINETLQGIEGLTKAFDVNSINLEQFKTVLENNEGIKGYYQSALDSGIGKGVASFKEKTLPGIIAEEVKKAGNKNKTPEQLELEQLKADMETMKAEKIKAERATKYTKVLADKKINGDLLNFILSNDDETTDKNIEILSNLINTNVTEMVKGKLTQDPPQPGSNGNPSESWTLDQAMTYMNEHPDADINSVMAKVK